MEDEDIMEQWVYGQIKEDNNAVYIEFQPEEATKKLKNIRSLPYAERKTYTNHLSELLPIIGPDVTNFLNETLKQLSEDSDEIKLILLKQLPDILKFLKTLENSYNHIKDVILNPIFDLLANQNLDIKEEAGKILSQVAELLTEQDRRDYILKIVIEMAHDDKNQENRMVAVQLMSKLAESFGQNLCDQFVGKQFLSLGDDQEARVMKESIINLPPICRVCSKLFYKQRLLPFFLQKCEDNKWGMRKACVDIIVALAEISDMEDRENSLTQVMTGIFLDDPNKWVKIAAFKNLGPFIATLQNGKINEKLFYYFKKMTDHNINYLSTNNDIMISCSYYFPAALLTFGKHRWDELKITLQTLIKHKNKNIRKPIACSLHEVAKIIEQERAEKDLFEVYEQILKDPSDEVKFGAIKNLAKFLSVFDKEKRESLVEVLQTVQKDPKKWRIRQLIAKQIGKLSKIYSTDVIFQYIMPIATKLCNDPVSIVREQASKKMYALVLALFEDTNYQIIIIEVIKGFSYSEKYSQRQVFVMICQKLMMYPQIFENHFLETFQGASKDKITNVRISVAKVITAHLLKKGPMSQHPVILEIIDTLKSDVCLEIGRQLSYVFEQETQKKEKINKQSTIQKKIEQQQQQQQQKNDQKENKQKEQTEQSQNEKDKLEKQEKERLQNEQMEKEAKERLQKEQKEKEEKEKLEKEEKEKLEKEQKEKLEKEQKEKEQKEKDEKEKLEKEQKENEEKERLEKEQKEKERLEKEEQERLEKEQKEKEEKERLEKEEKERLEKEEKERLEKEQKEKEEKERLEKEQKEKEEKERLEKEEKKRIEKEEKERIEKEEKERLEKEEKERLEKEEKERLEKEEKERLEKEEKERLEKEEKERIEKEEKEKLEKEEKERLEKEEKERIEKEEKERLEKEEKEEKERLEKEEKERLEKEKLEIEQKEKENLEKEEKEKLDKEEQKNEEQDEKQNVDNNNNQEEQTQDENEGESNKQQENEESNIDKDDNLENGQKEADNNKSKQQNNQEESSENKEEKQAENGEQTADSQ